MNKMNLWNIKNLPIPPINTYKPEDVKIDIKHLTNVFHEGKRFFNNEHYMIAEHKIMSIIIYRLKQKFRSAKDFKALEKLCTALNNYFETNISKDLENFMNLIPNRYTEDTYLPNKNMLDYILVRLQGIIKLLERIVETCKITASLLDTRIHTGHLWKIAFITFSLVSRIYILAKHSAKFVCKFYNKLFPFSNKLINGGRNWLPENYVLPPDLQKWINVNWLYIDDDLQIIEPSELPNISQFFDLVDDDDDNDDIQFCQEYIMIDDDEEIINEFKKLDDIKESIQKMRGFDMDEDIGEAIVINDDSLLFENDVLQTDDRGNGQNIRASENSSHTVMKENNLDFGEIIEVKDSPTVKAQKNGSNLPIIELSDTPQIINEDSSWDKIHYLPSSTPLRKVLRTATNFINVNNEVTVLRSPAVNKRNARRKTLQKKKKNLQSAVNEGTNKKSNKSTTLPKPSMTRKTDRKKISNQIFEEYSNNNNIKSIKKGYNFTMFPTMNKNFLGDGSGENVINISDTSLHEDEHKNIRKKKTKLKTKRNRNLDKNVNKEISESLDKYGVNTHASESCKLSSTHIVNLCGKRKRKKNKQKFQDSNKALWNIEDLRQIQSECTHIPNKKIKLDGIEKRSDNIKKILRNRIIDDSPKGKARRKKFKGYKKKMLKRDQNGTIHGGVNKKKRKIQKLSH